MGLTPSSMLLLAWLDEVDAPIAVVDNVTEALPSIEQEAAAAQADR